MSELTTKGREVSPGRLAVAELITNRPEHFIRDNPGKLLDLRNRQEIQTLYMVVERATAYPPLLRGSVVFNVLGPNAFSLLCAEALLPTSMADLRRILERPEFLNPKLADVVLFDAAMLNYKVTSELARRLQSDGFRIFVVDFRGDDYSLHEFVFPETEGAN